MENSIEKTEKRTFVARQRNRAFLAIVILFSIIIPPSLFLLVYFVSPPNLLSVLSTLTVCLSIVLTFFVIERKPLLAEEAVCIAVIVGAAVLSRAVFFFVPQFKPILGVVIIAGLAFGIRAGYLCGALSMLISNFLFGQGAWTAWQMCGAGAVGVIAGMMTKWSFAKKNRVYLFVFGIFAGFFYGIFADGFMILSMLSIGSDARAVFAALALSLPFNLVLSGATAIFLALFAPSIIKKIDRIKLKYLFYSD